MIQPRAVLSAIYSSPSITRAFDRITPVSREWSASGALHFEAVHRATQTPVDMKVGVTAHELFWTEAVSRHAPHLVPMLFMSGRQLGSFDIPWKVVEIAQGGVLGPQWGGREFEMLLAAGVEFQRIVPEFAPPIGGERLQIRTKEVVRQWLEDALPSQPPGPVQSLLRKFNDHYSWIERQCEFVISHGDLHMCNAVTRSGPPEGEVLLIDFAPCCQPWAFDAARLQVLNSTDPMRSGFRGLVHKMAAIRAERGLSTCADLDHLSRITLAWYAVVMWHLVPDRRVNAAYREIIGDEYIANGARV